MKRRDFLKGLVGVVGTSGLAVADGGRIQFPTSEFERLQLSVARAVRLERASQLRAVGAILPGLIRDCHDLVRHAPAQVRDARALLSQAQAIAAWVAIKEDRTREAAVNAEGALETARQADDPILVAASLRCMGEVHMRAAQYELACDLAIEAADFIERARIADHDAALSVSGAAYLSASMACARHGDEAGAKDLLLAAAARATELGRELSIPAVFGPANVRIHRVAIPVELGDPVTALQEADRAPITLPKGLEERRGRYLIDVARAFAARHLDAEAVHTLLQAEQVAPDETHTHRYTRSTLQHLLARERRSAIPDLRALAERCGALT